MKVMTHWPALVPAIRRAGYEPVLAQPLEYDGKPNMLADGNGRLIVTHVSAPAVVINPDGTVEVLP